ncbi:MAG: hypothetical protein WCK08_11340 [Betaproteobacteria bacterium]
MDRTLRIALWSALLALSAGVFMLYLQPAFLVLLAEQVWACF